MTKDKLKILLAIAIWGTIGIVRRYIPYSSGIVAFFRGAIGVLFLLLVRLVRRQRFSREEIRKSLPILCLSGVAIGVNWIFLFEAYRYTTISVATICNYMAPIFMIIASPFVLKERLTRKKTVCIGVALVGMILVSGVLETGISGMTGVLFGLGAAVLYAAVVLMNKRIVDMPGSDRTVIQLAVGTLFLIPYVLLTEDLSRLEFVPAGAAMLLLAGVVHTGFAYALYFGSFRHVPAQTIALYSYLDPIIAVILSTVVLREPLSVPAAIGVVLVLGAAISSEISFAPKKRYNSVNR